MTHNLNLFLAAAALAVYSAAPALAQDGPAGPVVIRNMSGAELTITNLRYVDAQGNNQAVAGEWKLKPDFYGYLNIGPNNNKIVAKKITYDLVTADGKTTGWSVQSRGLDADGDFVSQFSTENLATHHKLLGKVVALKPAQAAERQKVQQEINDLEEDVRVTNNRIIAARLTLATAKLAYDRAPAGSAQEDFAAGVYAGARIALAGLETYLQQRESALRSARSRLAGLRD